MPTGLQQQFAILRTLTLYVLRHKPYVLFATAIGIISSAIEVAAIASLIPLSLLAGGSAISSTSPWQTIPQSLGFTPNVQFFALTFMILITARTFLGSVNMFLIARAYRILIAHFSSRAMDAFIWHLTFESIQKQQIGHFIALTGDEANRAAQIIMYMMRIVPIAALLIFYLATLLYQSWLFGIMLIAFFVLTAICLQQAFRISLRLGRLQQDQARQASTHLLESLNGLRTVRGFNGEAYVASRYERMMYDYVHTCLKIDYINLASRALPALVLLGVILLAATRVDLAWFTQNLPYIFVGVMMTMRVLPLAGQLLDSGLRLISDLRAAENIGAILQAVISGSQQKKTEIARHPASNGIHSVEFEDVIFRYSDDTPLVLNRFNRVFKAGTSYAIMGPSGVGKSSMIDLMLKFYVPQAGTIRINGMNIAQMDSAWIRGHVALAEQTTRLFYDTVLSNIAFGREADRELGKKALRAVGMEEFISSLPEGMETLLHYQGSNFSGGQRQRIGLARALLLPADVLIIDEGTSALDAASKTLVIQNILAAYRDKIVIFVTHDQAVTDCVDEVITLSPAHQSESNEIAP